MLAGRDQREANTRCASTAGPVKKATSAKQERGKLAGREPFFFFLASAVLWGIMCNEGTDCPHVRVAENQTQKGLPKPPLNARGSNISKSHLSQLRG